MGSFLRKQRNVCKKLDFVLSVYSFLWIDNVASIKVPFYETCGGSDCSQDTVRWFMADKTWNYPSVS